MKTKLLKLIDFIFKNTLLWLSLFLLAKSLIENNMHYQYLSIIWFFLYLIEKIRDRVTELEKQMRKLEKEDKKNEN